VFPVIFKKLNPPKLDDNERFCVHVSAGLTKPVPINGLRFDAVYPTEPPMLNVLENGEPFVRNTVLATTLLNDGDGTMFANCNVSTVDTDKVFVPVAPIQMPDTVTEVATANRPETSVKSHKMGLFLTMAGAKPDVLAKPVPLIGRVANEVCENRSAEAME